MGRWNEKANLAEYRYALQEATSRACEPNAMVIGRGEEYHEAAVRETGKRTMGLDPGDQHSYCDALDIRHDECAFCIHRGLSSPVHLPTTNATSAFVVAAKDSPYY